MRITVLFTCCLSCAYCWGQDGTLDPNFNGDGIFVNDLSFYDDQARSVLVQPDGRILSAGWTDDGAQVTIALQRLLPSGTPDLQFGSGGIVLSPEPGHQRYAYAIDLQSSGAIIVAGVDYDLGLDANVLLMRYDASGILDATFGDGGVVSSDLGAGPGFQSAWAMRVLNDDRIVVVGEQGEDGVMCARFTADGQLDQSFGENGVALTGIPFGSGLAIDVLADGSILAGGYRIEGEDSDWMVVRFDPDGQLDITFGVAGVAIMDVGGGDVEILEDLDVLPDGRIAACGYRGSNGMDYAPVVAVLQDDGVLDEAFDGDGIRVFPFPMTQWGQAHAIHAQADGKLLVAGFRVEPGVSLNNDLFLIRLLPDGAYDPEFGTGGLVYTDLSGEQDRAYDMALQQDGRIVLAGYGTAQQRAFGYARYWNSISTGVVQEDAPPVLSVFPMPAVDHVTVRGLEVGVPVTVRSIQADGRSVLEQRMIGAADLRIPLGSSSGVYVLCLEQAGVSRTARVVVDHGH